MKEKIKKLISLIVIFCILAISLTGCSKEDEKKILKEKVGREIEFLELRLIDMLNNVNGISLYNYIVEAEQISEQSTSSKSTNDGNSVAVQTEEIEQGGSGQRQSQSSGSSQGQSQQQWQSGGQSQTSEGNTDNNSEVLYKMAGNEILLQDRKTDWTALKSDIEKLYSDWSTIQLDLYKMNVNSEEVLNFSSELDIATREYKK